MAVKLTNSGEMQCLQRKNLYLWERNVRAVLKPRKLLSHLTDDCPPENDPNFMQWIQEEEIVFAWLLDSLSPEQNARYVTYDTSKLLWEAISRNYSKRDDRQKIIDLYIKSFTLQQGDRDVLTYSNELRAVFNDLDHCRPPSTDSVARAYEATNRLCQFLQGLRPEFELIRSQLYNREIEPTFDQAVSNFTLFGGLLKVLPMLLKVEMRNTYLRRLIRSGKDYIVPIAVGRDTQKRNAGSFMEGLLIF